MKKLVFLILMVFYELNFLFAKEVNLGKKESINIISTLKSADEIYNWKDGFIESITLSDLIEDCEIRKITKNENYYFIYIEDEDYDYIILKIKNNKLIEMMSGESFKKSFIVQFSEKTSNAIYSKIMTDSIFCECWYNENGIISKSNFNNTNICIYDEFEQIINRKYKYSYENELLDAESWYTYQDGNLIYEKGLVYDSTIKWECYYDYDENNHLIYERNITNNENYIRKYKYDEKNRIIERYADDLNFNSLMIKYEYDNFDFINNIEFIVKGDSSWEICINDYKFENINHNSEYKIERLSDNQIKVIPKDNDKNWFILSK